MEKTTQTKTEITDVTLVDLLVVCQGLPQDEIDQIEAFTGNAYDPEQIAVQTYSSNGIKWTCRIKETAEPIVVAGFFQVGVSTWRSFMLASDLAWDEYGMEVTLHSRAAVKNLIRGEQHIRLETICLAGRDKALEWYPKIGLEYESTMPGYGVNGESAVLYTATQGAIPETAPSVIQMV